MIFNFIHFIIFLFLRLIFILLTKLFYILINSVVSHSLENRILKLQNTEIIFGYVCINRLVMRLNRLDILN